MGLFSNQARTRIFLSVCGAALALGGGSSLAETPHGHGLAGFWQASFDDGKPSGWFYFTDKDGVVEGRLVKMYTRPGEAKPVEFCTSCTGAQKGAPMLGLVLVWGMKRTEENKYQDGNILDPRNGSVYGADLQVSPDGQKLFVRGYVGISLFGQTQTWTRLPDDALPAGAIPGEVSPLDAKMKALAPDRAMAAPVKTPKRPKTPPSPPRTP